MPKKSKIQRGFLPIFAKDIRRMIGYCETWGFGNKDTCKYVAENTIEQMELKGIITLTDEQKSKANSDLISITHDINSGGNYKGREILIPIK